MCHKHYLGLVFLSEMKNMRLLLKHIQADLGFEPLGLTGSLTLFSKDEFQINFLFLNNKMIDIEAFIDDIEAFIDGINIFMTFVYGDPVLKHRNQVWERL